MNYRHIAEMASLIEQEARRLGPAIDQAIRMGPAIERERLRVEAAITQTLRAAEINSCLSAFQGIGSLPSPQTDAGDVPCAVETQRQLGSRLRNHL